MRDRCANYKALSRTIVTSLNYSLPPPAIVVAIPSLHGGALLEACLRSLDAQTHRDFEVVVVDNSGGMVQTGLSGKAFTFPLHIEVSPRNLGFAAAVNRAWSIGEARFLATLNDDAEAHPQWLSFLKVAMEQSPDIGMCASRVRIHGAPLLDSAGMLICADGSSKQRGQGQPPELFHAPAHVLFPSAAAALYRREMLDDVGLFDGDFFLYCEDTDLGLRARWNGWESLYVPEAIADHHYSQSAGPASPLKAWQIERNRLWVAAKNFPLRILWMVPFVSAVRYFWHAVYLLQGHGTAARYRGKGNGVHSLFGIILRAHWSLITNFRMLRAKRLAIRRGALITDRQFIALLKRHAISPREIARL